MLLLALACAGPDDTASDTAGLMPWSYPLDDTLRITDAQVLATHNSYHVAPDPYVVPDWDYTMPPLAEQLAMGVRGIELQLDAAVMAHIGAQLFSPHRLPHLQHGCHMGRRGVAGFQIAA